MMKMMVVVMMRMRRRMRRSVGRMNIQPVLAVNFAFSRLPLWQPVICFLAHTAKQESSFIYRVSLYLSAFVCVRRREQSPLLLWQNIPLEKVGHNGSRGTPVRFLHVDGGMKNMTSLWPLPSPPFSCHTHTTHTYTQTIDPLQRPLSAMHIMGCNGQSQLGKRDVFHSFTNTMAGQR